MKAKLWLFVAAGSTNGRVAEFNVRKALDRRGEQAADFDVIDVDEDPARALAWRVFVTPALVWESDPLGRRLVGDLSSETELTAFLD